MDSNITSGYGNFPIGDYLPVSACCSTATSWVAILNGLPIGLAMYHTK